MSSEARKCAEAPIPTQGLTVSDSLGPPIPPEFSSCWNREIDEAIASSTLPQDIESPFLGFRIESVNDSISIGKLKEHSIAMARASVQENQDSSQGQSFERSLRNVLCKTDYTKMELSRLHRRIARNEELITSYSEENMKLKQELFSLQERLLRHEEQEEQMLKVVEQLRRIVVEQPSPAGREDRKMKVGEVTVISQIKDTLGEVRQPQGDIRKPASGPGYFNRKDDKRAWKGTPIRNLLGRTLQQHKQKATVQQKENGTNREHCYVRIG